MTADAEVTVLPDVVDFPHRDLIEQAARFSQTFLRWLDRAGGGLTYPRLRVLEVLHCQGPAKMKDLADSVGMSARNLTTLADGLEADSLVRRLSHPSDRRSTLLELTEAGVAAAECSLAPRLAEISALFDSLRPAEREQLRSLLHVLLTVMETCPNADSSALS